MPGRVAALSRRQVCAALGIGEREFWRLVESGELDRGWSACCPRVTEQALEEYIARRLPGQEAS
jgi:hypothetical protein